MFVRKQHAKIFNHTHSFKDHRFPRSVGSDTESTTDSTLSGGRESGSTSGSSSAAGNVASFTRLSPVTDTQITEIKKKEKTEENNLHVDSDPDGLEFVGAYIADINVNGEAWMATVQDPSSLTLQVGDTLEQDVKEEEVF